MAVLAFVAGCAGYARPVEPRPRPPRPSGPAPSFTLTAFDVGTGLAVFVRGEDFTLLYDGGSNDDRKLGPDNRLLAYLRPALGPPDAAECADEDAPRSNESSRTLDHLFLSHPHRDHLQLLPDVLRCHHVANVWESGLEGDTAGYRTFRDAITSERGVVHHVGGRDFTSGHSFRLGRSASAVVLSVRPDAKEPNDASIVLRLDLGGTRVLLMGDATGGERRVPEAPPDRGSTEQSLLSLGRKALAADVLVVGHHGSKTSTRAALLDAVRPKVAVVSSGPMPYAGVVLPDRDIIDLLVSRGIKVHRTDESDDKCRDAESKVGRDHDGSPGGCSAVTVEVERGTLMRVTHEPASD